MRTHKLDHWLLVRLAAQNAHEILAPIGAGGMGKVYRAQEPSAIAMQAIKALPIGRGAGCGAASSV